jgi:WD domain, G-beta repeat
MAMANVAWILASNGKRVLAMDWDLEAPGLHRYFRPFLHDPSLESTPGLIDFVLEYASAAVTPASPDEKRDSGWYKPYTDLTDYTVSLDWRFPSPGTLDFVGAGQQGPGYSQLVNEFSWKKLYEELGGEGFFNEVKAQLRSEYDYILIDSRTGFSDTSGICTIQMPDALVICFTLNNQSVDGAAKVAETVNARRNPPSASPKFPIFPVPMRVRQDELERLEKRERYAQDLFRPYLRSESYWGAVAVPEVAYYGYEEALAIFRDRPSKVTTVLASFERLTAAITSQAIRELVPPTEDERQDVLTAFARTPQSTVDSAPVAATSWWRLTAISLAFVVVLVAFGWATIDALSKYMGRGARASAIVAVAREMTGSDPMLAALLLRELRNLPEPPGAEEVAAELASKNIPIAELQVGSAVTSVQFDMPSRRLLTASAAGAQLWRVDTQALMAASQAGAVRSAAFSRDETRIATVGADREVRILDGKLGEIAVLKQTSPCKARHGANVATVVGYSPPQAARFSPDGKALVVGYENHSVVMYSPSTGECLDWYVSRSRTGGPVFNNDGSWLATLSASGEVDVFNTLTWGSKSYMLPTDWIRPLLALAPSTGAVLLSPSVRLSQGTASAGTDDPMVVFDLVNRRAVLDQGGDVGAFSPDSLWIVAADSRSAYLRVRYLYAGTDEPLPGTVGGTGAVAYSQDGRFLATGSQNGKVRIWPSHRPEIPESLTWPSLLSYFDTIHASLTPTQRRQLLGE